MPTIYVCYADDDKSYAEYLIQEVRSQGIEVLTGSPERKQWEADINRSDIFFLILSQPALDSLTISTQYHYAFAQSKKIVVVHRGEVAVPALLRSAQVIEATGEDDTTQIIASLVKEYQQYQVDQTSAEIPKGEDVPLGERILLDVLEPEAPAPATPPASIPGSPAEEKPAPPPPPPPAIQPQAAPSRPLDPETEQAPPSRQPTTVAGKPIAAIPEEFFHPQYSAFYPSQVEPAKPYALMVFVHVESALAMVREEAGRYQAMMGGQPTSGTVSSQTRVAQGTLLTFVPQINGLSFTPAEQVITWKMDKPYESATFLFQTPMGISGTLNGRVLVYQGPLIIGEIPLTIEVVTTGATGDLTAEKPFQKLQPIFASYSHRDTPVMEYFRKTRQSLGQKMLVDIYDLRSGEHWADRLLEWIDDSAVFQLFWSKHSAASPYCRQEWQYALKYVPQRERFIQPVWWESPMTPPPPELANLHFQKVTLPPVTRLRMLASRVRGVFGG